MRTIGLPNLDGPPPPGLVLAESAALLASVGTLSRVAESLAEVPQRRKAVIFVTVGVPVDAAGASEITIVTPEDGAGAAEIGSVSRRLMDVMKETYRRAQRANVNIYTVSPAGVGGMAAYIQSQQWQGRFVPPTRRSLELPDSSSASPGIGGRVLRTQRPATALTQVFLENGPTTFGYHAESGADGSTAHRGHGQLPGDGAHAQITMPAPGRSRRRPRFHR
jgi:hypothetical protein